MDANGKTCNEKFRTVAGLGLLFDPSCLQSGTGKKHQCADCHFCQGCSESRCHTCRSSRTRAQGLTGSKLSLREQICLYEAINREME